MCGHLLGFRMPRLHQHWEFTLPLHLYLHLNPHAQPVPAFAHARAFACTSTPTPAPLPATMPTHPPAMPPHATPAPLWILIRTCNHRPDLHTGISCTSDSLDPCLSAPATIADAACVSHCTLHPQSPYLLASHQAQHSSMLLPTNGRLRMCQVGHTLTLTLHLRLHLQIHGRQASKEESGYPIKAFFI